MSIYVDEVKEYPACKLRYHLWSHMVSGPEDADCSELHAFAAKIGLKPEWAQVNKPITHYDVIPSKRKRAIAMGAIAVDRNKFVEIIRARRDI